MSSAYHLSPDRMAQTMFYRGFLVAKIRSEFTNVEGYPDRDYPHHASVMLSEHNRIAAFFADQLKTLGLLQNYNPDQPPTVAS